MEVGHSTLMSSIFHGLAGNFYLRTYILNVTLQFSLTQIAIVEKLHDFSQQQLLHQMQLRGQA